MKAVKWQNDKRRIRRVIGRICNRTERRVRLLCDQNPHITNSILSSDWSTPMENEIMHSLKMALIPLEQKERANGVARNRLIIELSKRLNISRSKFRAQVKHASLETLRNM